MRGLFSLEGFLLAISTVFTTIIFSAACCQTIRHHFVSTTPTPQKYYYSIALAGTTPGPDGHKNKLATAWAIDEDHLMTAGHFCKTVEDGIAARKVGPLVSLTQVGGNGEPVDTIDTTILKRHPDRDICILVSPGHPFVPLIISENFNLVRTEDPIVMIGAPKGFFPVRREGTLAEKSAHRFSDLGEFILLSVQTQKGNSGSPVIWHGEVIGMTVRLPVHLQQSALAVPAPHLLEFIREEIIE